MEKQTSASFMKTLNVMIHQAVFEIPVIIFQRSKPARNLQSLFLPPPSMLAGEAGGLAGERGGEQEPCTATPHPLPKLEPAPQHTPKRKLLPPPRGES